MYKMVIAQMSLSCFAAVAAFGAEPTQVTLANTVDLKSTAQKRFVFNSPGIQHPNCSHPVDPRVYNKSPWLSELQDKLESVWETEQNFHKNEETIACKIDLDRNGKLIHLEPFPANINATNTAEQNAALDIIRRVASVTPPDPAVATSNKITICVEFRQYPKYSLKQWLTPIK
jgi:hypothetical protein